MYLDFSGGPTQTGYGRIESVEYYRDGSLKRVERVTRGPDGGLLKLIDEYPENHKYSVFDE